MDSIADLKGWQHSKKLGLEIYKLTRSLPKSEQFCLTQQLRRCSISVSSNIAEGLGRQSKADKLHFYMIARGSLYELESQLIICRELTYLDKQAMEDTMETIYSCKRLLQGLINSTRKIEGQ